MPEEFYDTPAGPIDRAYWKLIQYQRIPFLGRVIRQLLKARGIDIPPSSLAPGRHLILRHAGNVVIHGQSKIGNHVILHQGVTVGRGDIWRAPDPTFDGFILEDHVILCANAVVASSKGQLVIGEGTVVGANSTLTTSTGPWEIWAGSPARRVGYRSHGGQESPSDVATLNKELTD